MVAEEQRVRQRTDLPKRYSLGLLFRLPVPKLYLPQLCLSNIRQGFESPPLFKPEELFFFACGHAHALFLSLSLAQILCTYLCIWVNVHWEQISWVVHAGPRHWPRASSSCARDHRLTLPCSPPAALPRRPAVCVGLVGDGTKKPAAEALLLWENSLPKSGKQK